MRVKRIVCFEWMPAAMSIETEAGAASHLRQLYEPRKLAQRANQVSSRCMWRAATTAILTEISAFLFIGALLASRAFGTHSFSHRMRK